MVAIETLSDPVRQFIVELQTENLRLQKIIQLKNDEIKLLN